MEKRKSYAEYKQTGGNNRKLNKSNSFKNRIYGMIREAKKEDIYLNKALKICFAINHLETHAQWLEGHFEEESNYYHTYVNIQKCKNRALRELLFATNHLKVMVNKKGKTDKRLWLAVFTVEYKNLTITCVTNYKDVESLIGRLAIEETDIEEPSTVLLSDENEKRVLDKQQYFTATLREMLNKVDDETMKLIRYKNLYENNNK